MDQLVPHLTFLRSAVESIPKGKELTLNLEKQTGLAIEHVLAGVELLLVIFLFCGIGAGFIANLIGFAYPAYASLRTLEPSFSTSSSSLKMNWKFYWVAYCGVGLVDSLIENALLYWLPFYHPLKVAFLLWMMLPQTKGANVLAAKLGPTLKDGLAGWVEQIKGKIEKITEEVKEAKNR
jgi:hypothetical protein